MIKIVYDPVELAFRATGHAGYDEQGRDIVCAAVSALMFTLSRAAMERGVAIETRGREDMGDLFVKLEPRADQRFPAYIMAETIAVGLGEIARTYPENVSFIKEE